MKVNLQESEVFTILMSLAVDFEQNKKLIENIIAQMEIPLSNQKQFWDRFLYIYNKIYKKEKK